MHLLFILIQKLTVEEEENLLEEKVLEEKVLEEKVLEENLLEENIKLNDSLLVLKYCKI